MPMDVFVGAAVNEERAIVIDTGFTAAVAAKRRRNHLRCPIESLGHDPEVMRRYPAVPGPEGIAVELHGEPGA